jgi:hypothetical protein
VNYYGFRYLEQHGEAAGVGTTVGEIKSRTSSSFYCSKKNQGRAQVMRTDEGIETRPKRRRQGHLRSSEMTSYDSGTIPQRRGNWAAWGHDLEGKDRANGEGGEDYL